MAARVSSEILCSCSGSPTMFRGCAKAFSPILNGRLATGRSLGLPPRPRLLGSGGTAAGVRHDLYLLASDRNACAIVPRLDGQARPMRKPAC